MKDNREFLSPHVLSKVESRNAVAVIIGIENYKMCLRLAMQITMLVLFTIMRSEFRCTRK